jgi:diacylglycerol kinase family enzyme
MGTDASLGVLPLGTLNHFAKDLGIPLKLEDAIRTLFTGRAIAIDVGEVNGKIFLNNSSLGLYPRIVRQREVHQKHGLPKWFAMLRAIAYVARHHRALYLRLKIDDARAKIRKTPFIFIGNNRYELTGLNVGKRGALTGGRLWICRAPDVGGAGLLRLTLRALAGRLKDRDLEATEAQEAWIETHSAQTHVSTDGEVQTIKGALHYRIRPQALKVIVPEPQPPTAG